MAHELEMGIGAAVLLLLLVLLFFVYSGPKPTTPPAIEGFAESKRKEVYEYVYDTNGIYIGMRLKSLA